MLQALVAMAQTTSTMMKAHSIAAMNRRDRMRFAIPITTGERMHASSPASKTAATICLKTSRFPRRVARTPKTTTRLIASMRFPIRRSSRRRLGPFLLLFALLAVAAIAAGTIYLYQKNAAGPFFARNEAPVPVVAGDGQAVKAEPEAVVDVQEPAENNQSGKQQVSSAPSVPSSAQRKQIYDRILGETTLEEQEKLAPGEEQPLKPPPESQNAGPALETQSDSVSGQALELGTAAVAASPAPWRVS